MSPFFRAQLQHGAQAVLLEMCVLTMARASQSKQTGKTPMKVVRKTQGKAVQRKVFKDQTEVRKYITALKQKCGPNHATMAMCRVVFGARVSQIRTLRRRHVDLTKGMLYLQPQKGHPGEFVQMPMPLLEACWLQLWLCWSFH